MESKHLDVYIRIGLNILYYRKQQKITQQRLAELTNYSRNHIQQIETASAVPSLDALLDIAEALQVSIEALFAAR